MKENFEQYDYLKPLHKELKEIVKEFDSLCNELKISYFIGYGTLLGAVRHGDIIPWDDDIDLLMLRKDYDTLIKYFKNNKNPQYDFLCPELSDDCYVLFGKFLKKESNNEFRAYFHNDKGLSVDVFPLDYCRNDKNLLQKITNLRITILSRAIYSRNVIQNGDNIKQSGIKKIIRNVFIIPFCLFSKRFLLNHTLKIMKRISNDNADRVINYGIRYKHSRVNFDKRIFDQSIRLSLGKGYDFLAPQRYEDYLVQVYGSSYMEIPKEKDRYHHEH